MLKLVKRHGIYTEESVFYINCYKRKYGYELASDAIAHIEKDNRNELVETARPDYNGNNSHIHC